jgi:uncharacterized protein YybS (DUF2232 family)
VVTIFTKRVRTAVALCLLLLLVAILIHPLLDIRHGQVTRSVAWNHLSLLGLSHAFVPSLAYISLVPVQHSTAHLCVKSDRFSPLLC